MTNSRNDTDGRNDKTMRRIGLLAQSRGVLVKALGADPENLIYLPNATTGVNTVARSLRLQPYASCLPGSPVKRSRTS
jgi:selenocysteine lyase/cysteine desulfurase